MYGSSFFHPPDVSWMKRRKMVEKGEGYTLRFVYFGLYYKENGGGFGEPIKSIIEEWTLCNNIEKQFTV
jgi:hypothetical protein